MGPEVEAVLQGIEGTTATVSASVGESLATLGVKLEEATGTGEGESGSGGFAGLAANVMKAEKIMSGLAGGSGFGRMGGMLESITGALGLAGGVGMAGGGLIFALEVLIPKIEAFISKMDGAAEATKRATDALKEHQRVQEAAQKIIEQPTTEAAEAKKEVEGLIGGGRGGQIQTGIAQGLQAGGFGLTKPQLDFISKVQSGALPRTKENLDRVSELLNQQQQAIQERSAEMLTNLPTSPQTQGVVEGMAPRPPRTSPT